LCLVFAVMPGIAQDERPAATPKSAGGKPAPGTAAPATKAPVHPTAVVGSGSTSKVNLDTSETLFSFASALSACGFGQVGGQEPEGNDPLRTKIRAELRQALDTSEPLAEFTRSMCQFYRDHQTGDSGRDYAQYVSLALFVDGPPTFKAKMREAELPPDAVYVAGFLPLVAEFYQKAKLHDLWLKHRSEYNGLIEHYSDAVAKMVFDTDVYLKLAFSGYLGREFVVYLEPLGALGQVNARNYGENYYVVLTPSGDARQVEQIRHTYLHYVLDPMALKHPSAIQRLSPLLDLVKTAPMDESFKGDISLLLTESLIRAIEIRTRKATLDEQKAAVLASMEEGYILTDYFSEALVGFEKDPAGLQSMYGEMITAIDGSKVARQATTIQFAAQASPEVVVGVRPRRSALQPTLRLAEQKLSTGDIAGAQKLAQQALDEKKEDTGYALFILARASTMSRDMEGARSYFERTLEVSKEQKLIAWSHIYLGRIYDLQEDRDSALEQYKAALKAGDPSPEVKNAAEKGLQQAYEPPRPAQPPQ
jgi:predicted negative regulator of RcsB-dependent stress response